MSIVSKEKAEQAEAGFTLIELLTSVTIVGILASIALGHYSTYRMRAFDGSAETDLRSTVAAEEAYFVDNESYIACVQAECETVFTGFTLSDGVRVEVEISADGGEYIARAHHPQGSASFEFDSLTASYTTN